MKGFPRQRIARMGKDGINAAIPGLVGNGGHAPCAGCSRSIGERGFNRGVAGVFTAVATPAY